MRKKAIEAGKDELSKKKDTLRQELTDKYMAILQRMRPEVYRVKCGLHALKCLVTDPGCHVHLQGLYALHNHVDMVFFIMWARLRHRHTGSRDQQNAVFMPSWFRSCIL